MRGLPRRSVTAVTAVATMGVAAPAVVRAQVARKPLIWADVPDMAVLRDGDTYYMSSTTMHMVPGMPIMKSRDLVNWEMVRYAHDELADLDALALRGGQQGYGRGSWASSLRKYRGEYIVSTFSASTGQTHIARTRDLKHGPRTRSAFAPALHDHTLVFEDDGRVYAICGQGDIQLRELLPDLSGLKPGGEDRVIIRNAGAVAGPPMLNAEGSQLVRHDGRYYLFQIIWPRGGMRTQLVYRANALSGPYEGRVVLQDRGIAQGSIIDTPDGRWFACLFRDAGAVGRIPYLVPMRWVDGWPVLGTQGRVPDVLAIPMANDPIPRIVASDEFTRCAGEPPVGLAWQWNHNPAPAKWSLTARTGWLRLAATRIDQRLPETQSTLTQRMFGPRSTAVVALDVSGLRDGDVAGLGALQQQYGYVGVTREAGTNAIVMVQGAGEAAVEVVRVPLASTRVFLRSSSDFEQQRDTAAFAYSLDGTRWTTIGNAMPMRYTLPHFMGYRFALFHPATRAVDGHADFDYFRLSGDATAPREATR